MDKTKVYVAGSWKNRFAIRVLMNEIEIMGHQVAVDWTEHKSSGYAKQYAAEDLKGLQECHCLIYCLDGIKSRGKNFELGYVTALGRPIALYILPTYGIVIGSDNRILPLEHLTDSECVFIRANLYPIIHSIDQLKSWLSNTRLNRYEKE